MSTHAANDPIRERASPCSDLAMCRSRRSAASRSTEPARDLYIPPEALSVFLDAFEGPLDLLLYLIRRPLARHPRHPMAELTRQYMEYVEMMRTTQLELAADYLLMAALLLEIKSRMLLPRPKRDDVSEPETPGRAGAPPPRVRAHEEGRQHAGRHAGRPAATSRWWRST
jgi:segregation and condensation protein A